MNKVNFQCYLCREEAERLIEFDNTRDEIVQCTHCINRYRVTPGALIHYLDRKEGNEVLTPEDRYKLSEYVYEQVVRIDTDVIKNVTGK